MVSTIALHLAALAGCIMHTLEGLTLWLSFLHTPIMPTSFLTHQLLVASVLRSVPFFAVSSKVFLAFLQVLVVTWPDNAT